MHRTTLTIWSHQPLETMERGPLDLFDMVGAENGEAALAAVETCAVENPALFPEEWTQVADIFENDPFDNGDDDDDDGDDDEPFIDADGEELRCPRCGKTRGLSIQGDVTGIWATVQSDGSLKYDASSNEGFEYGGFSLAHCTNCDWSGGAGDLVDNPNRMTDEELEPPF